MKCFYHNDLDGRCAAAILYNHRKAIGTKSRHGETYIEMDYDRAFPFDEVLADEEVFILDFSLQKEGEFQRLLEITPNVIWIDHHKSAIEKHAAIADRMMGVQDTSKAGCVLTWEFLNTAPLPEVVELVGDYDIWAFEFGDRTRDLHAGMVLEETDPTHPNWDTWLRVRQCRCDWAVPPGMHVINNGGVLRKASKKKATDLIKQIAFHAEFEGYRCICCNNPRKGSGVFDSVDPTSYDFMFSFFCSDRGWTVSLYNSKGLDGTELARKYGGGGHPGACGFQCKQLFFKDGKVEVITECERMARSKL